MKNVFYSRASVKLKPFLVFFPAGLKVCPPVKLRCWRCLQGEKRHLVALVAFLSVFNPIISRITLWILVQAMTLPL